MATIHKAWVADAGGELVLLAMRIDEEDWNSSVVEDPIDLNKFSFPKDKDPAVRDVHLTLGLLDGESLMVIRNAIDKYLAGDGQ